MSRLQKMTKYTVCSIVLCLVLFCSFSFTSNASGMFEFSVSAAEPAKTSNSGYITCLLYNKDNDHWFPYTYAWNVYGTADGADSPRMMNIRLQSGRIEFTPYGLVGSGSVSTGTFYSLMVIDSQGVFRMLKQSSTDKHTITWSDNITCYGYQVYGNGYLDYDGVGAPDNFVVHWATDESAVLLQELYNLLLTMQDGSSMADMSDKLQLLYQRMNVTNVRLQSIIDSLDNFKSSFNEKIDLLNIKVGQVYEEIISINNTLDDILVEQKKQTTWLEKIWNSIQEFFGSSDEEKQKGDDFKENSANQNDELGDLITDSEVEKPDIEDITDDIDTNIDLNSVSNFGEFLSCIIDNEYVSRCLLMVGVMLIMGYVLFGKRG